MTLRGRFSPHSLRELVALVREKNIQVINAQSSKDRYLAILARWLYGINCVVLHTRRQTPRADGGWFQKTLYVQGTDKIIVISEELKRIFVDKGYPEKHFHVIHNGIPAEKYQLWSPEKVEQFRQQLGLQPGDVVIGSVSRLKKQEQIIRCLPLLNLPEAKVLLVGVRSGTFDALVATLGIKNQILYVDEADGSEVLNYYKLCSVNVLASITDGFGLVLLEAMAMGCPVVATNFGGIKDVVKHGHNGLLFENDDTAQLAQSIRQILGNEPLRQQLIANGKTTAFETFSMERTLDRYERFYQSMWTQRESPPGQAK
jgi:glycosyltransferase involved in cell wall biosynthesis